MDGRALWQRQDTQQGILWVCSFAIDTVPHKNIGYTHYVFFYSSHSPIGGKVWLMVLQTTARGVFAVVFATALCTGHDPASKVYNQSSMREHTGKDYIFMPEHSPKSRKKKVR